MNVSERQQDILKKLTKYGRVSVKELAIDYRVTEDLIRKDLKKMEHLNLLDRVYGGAERKHNKFEASSIHYRMQINQAQKEAIAQEAVKLIDNGHYIFLDTSSTSAHIATLLASSGKELTVITDMLIIMELLAPVDGITLIAIGGQYNPYTGGFTGHEALRQIQQYTVDLAFISCRSVSLKDRYLIEGFIDIGNSKRAILDSARKRIVATEAIKYQSSGIYKFYPLEAIDTVIIDRPLSEEATRQLQEMEIELKYATKILQTNEGI